MCKIHSRHTPGCALIEEFISWKGVYKIHFMCATNDMCLCIHTGTQVGVPRTLCHVCVLVHLFDTFRRQHAFTQNYIHTCGTTSI